MAYLSLVSRYLHRQLQLQVQQQAHDTPSGSSFINCIESRASFLSKSPQHQKVFKCPRIQQVKRMTEYHVTHYLSNTSLIKTLVYAESVRYREKIQSAQHTRHSTNTFIPNPKFRTLRTKVKSTVSPSDILPCIPDRSNLAPMEGLHGIQFCGK